MTSNVVLFTLKGCYHCDSLKEKLNNSSIPFNHLDIENVEEIWDQIVEQTESDVVPVVLIYNDNDGELFVPGKDYETEDEIVEIIKSYIKGT